MTKKESKESNHSNRKVRPLRTVIYKFLLRDLFIYVFISLFIFASFFLFMLNYFYDVQSKSLISNYSVLLKTLEKQYKIEFSRGYDKIQQELRALHEKIESEGYSNQKIFDSVKSIILNTYPLIHPAQELNLVDEASLKLLANTTYGMYILENLQKSKSEVDYVIYNVYFKDFYKKIFYVKLGERIILLESKSSYYLETFKSFLNLKDYNKFISKIDIFTVSKDEIRFIDGRNDLKNDDLKSLEKEIHDLYKKYEFEITNRYVNYFGEKDKSSVKDRTSLSDFKVVKKINRIYAYVFLNLITEREIGECIVGRVVLDFSQITTMFFSIFISLFVIAILIVLYTVRCARKFVNHLGLTFSKLVENIKLFSYEKIFTLDVLDFDSDIFEVQEILEEYTKLAQELTAAYQEQTALTQQLEASYKEIEYAHRELEKSYLEFAGQLAVIAENYDENTGAHISRVSKLSRFIAEKLGISPDLCEKIEKFSPLHDIGKVLCPKEILLKNGPLTSQEFEIMKQHTINGARLIGDNPNLEIAKNIALYHHEKYDGSGYPMGLKGDAIPVEARIVAIVDVYDALRSNRPYKKGFTHEESLRILLEGDNRTKPEHFDPMILKVFKENESEICNLWETYNKS